jgi:hypothetical protein
LVVFFRVLAFLPAAFFFGDAFFLVADLAFLAVFFFAVFFLLAVRPAFFLLAFFLLAFVLVTFFLVFFAALRPDAFLRTDLLFEPDVFLLRALPAPLTLRFFFVATTPLLSSPSRA